MNVTRFNVQTDKILIQTGMLPALFSVTEGAKERCKIMNEVISKIKQFAFEHSDGIEDAEKLQDMLIVLLSKIDSYCHTGVKFNGPKNTGKVEICVVAAIEGLSVFITSKDDEWHECFVSGISSKEVEKQFVRLLGF